MERASRMAELINSTDRVILTDAIVSLFNTTEALILNKEVTCPNCLRYMSTVIQTVKSLDSIKGRGEIHVSQQLQNRLKSIQKRITQLIKTKHRMEEVGLTIDDSDMFSLEERIKEVTMLFNRILLKSRHQTIKENAMLTHNSNVMVNYASEL